MLHSLEKWSEQQLFQHFDGCGFPETVLRFHDIGDIVEHERAERHIRDILVFAVTVSLVTRAEVQRRPPAVILFLVEVAAAASVFEKADEDMDGCSVIGRFTLFVAALVFVESPSDPARHACSLRILIISYLRLQLLFLRNLLDMVSQEQIHRCFFMPRMLHWLSGWLVTNWDLSIQSEKNKKF